VVVSPSMSCGYTFEFCHKTKNFSHYYTDCHEPIVGEVKDWVLNDLAEALPDFNIDQYFSSQPTIFSDYDHLVLTIDDATGKIVGLIGSRWLRSEEVECLYIWTAVVGNDYRRTTCFPEMLRVHFNRVLNDETPFPAVVATKTYNPLVYRLLDIMFCKTPNVSMYPSLVGREISEKVKEDAGRVARLVAPKLDYCAESSTVYGGQAAVAPDFFPYMQKTSVEAIWNHFTTHLSRDDQILCVIDIPSDTERDEVVRRNKWDIL